MLYFMRLHASARSLPCSPCAPPRADLSSVHAGSALTALVLAATLLDVDFEGLILGDGLTRDGLSAGDVAAATLWTTSLWFASPLQLLLLFLGKLETERPSDWAMNLIGRAARLPVDELDYEHPLPVRAAAAAGTVAVGCGTAFALKAGLGDATWGVSSGLACCMAAGIYELGRPDRLSGEEAVKLEEQWQTFARFADRRLQRGGRCHESEIWRAFEAEHPSFRKESERIDAQYLRDMVSNWQPKAQRTSGGYYKNVSLRSQTDPFTGEAVGVDLSAVSVSDQD